MPFVLRNVVFRPNVAKQPEMKPEPLRESIVSVVIPEVVPEVVIPEVVIPEVVPEVVIPEVVIPEVVLPEVVPVEALVATEIPAEEVKPDRVLSSSRILIEVSTVVEDQVELPGAPTEDA